jgi:hypothetical protein
MLKLFLRNCERRVVYNANIRISSFHTSYICSDNITYSGGHANVGQGGFYGSGGSRVSKNVVAHHPEAMARQADIKDLVAIMNEVESIDTDLQSLGNVVSSRSIELKARLKKTVQNPKVRELLARLEIKGEPVWGLSVKERSLVVALRSRYLSS